MNRKSWLIALITLALGACGAVAITQGTQEDSTIAATPPATTGPTETGDSKKQKQTKKNEKSDEKPPAEQDVEQTVEAYVTALEQGDTEAMCEIQTQALTVEVNASGGSGEEIAEACVEAAEQDDWDELWAAWASQIDLDDVQLDVDGGQASVSLTGGTSFSLDRQRSGEWKVDGVQPSPQGRQAPPAPQVPQAPQAPESPQVPQSPQLPKLPQLPQR